MRDDAKDDAKPSDEAPRAADQGRRQVVAMGFSVIGATILADRMSSMPFTQTMVKVVALAAGFLFLAKGRAFARWLLVFACGFLAVTNVLAGIAGLDGDGPAWLGFVLAAVHGFAVAILLLSRPLGAHLAYEQSRGRANEPRG